MEICIIIYKYKYCIFFVQIISNMNLQRTIYLQYYFIIKYEIYEISLFMNNNTNRISIFQKTNTLRIIQRIAVLKYLIF